MCKCLGPVRARRSKYVLLLLKLADCRRQTAVQTIRKHARSQADVLAERDDRPLASGKNSNDSFAYVSIYIVIRP